MNVPDVEEEEAVRRSPPPPRNDIETIFMTHPHKHGSMSMSDNFSETGAAAIVAAILLTQRGTMTPSQGDVDEAAASAARIIKAARAALHADEPEPARRTGFSS